jgi:ribosome-interacting GTPase 1
MKIKNLFEGYFEKTVGDLENKIKFYTNEMSKSKNISKNELTKKKIELFKTRLAELKAKQQNRSK